MNPHHHEGHTRSSHEKEPRNDNPHYHHARAHKIVTLIETYVKEAITSVDNLKVDTDKETIALLTETNSFANDLQGVVHAILRLVIKAYKKDKPSHDVASTAKVFSDYVLSIQKSFHRDIPVLKNNLKQALNGAVPEAHKLWKLLDHETNTGSRHAIVKILSDLLFSVRKLLRRNEIENASCDRLEKIATHLQQKIVDELAKLTKTDPHAIGDFNSCSAHLMRHMLLAVRTVDEEAVDYEGETETKLLEMTYHASEDIAACDKAFRTKHILETLKEQAIILTRHWTGGMKDLVLLSKNVPANANVTFDNLVRLVYAHSIAAIDQYVAIVDHIVKPPMDEADRAPICRLNM